MKGSKSHGGKLRWEQQTSCPMTAGGSGSPKCLRCSQSMRKPKSMKIVPKCPERSVEYLSSWSFLPFARSFSRISPSPDASSSRPQQSLLRLPVGPGYLQNYRRPAFYGFQICWGAGQHPQNHLPSVHAVRTPQVSKCLQDAPTIYAARPRKTCLCDQDNEHTLLQPFWRQLQAWQEPTNLVASQHLLPLPVYIENHWNISQFLATLSPCQWPQHPKGTEALWSTLENLSKWKRSQTHSACTVKNRNKFRTGSSKIFQDALSEPRVSHAMPRRTTCVGLDQGAYPHCAEHESNMNLNESNDLHETSWNCTISVPLDLSHHHVTIANHYHV